MKVVVLVGGFGSRLADLTEAVPKPMVPVGGQPLLWHLMRIFAARGHRDFVLALGYRAEVIKSYFQNFQAMHADFTVDLGTGSVVYHDAPAVDWRVSLVDTGLPTMTGGRLRRLRACLGDEPFLMTYGDGLADLDLDALLAFHRAHGKLVTVTAVHPAARFGEMTLDGDRVRVFKEKPQTAHGWVNGGFFVMEPAFLNLIDSDATVLEAEPLERAAAMGQLMAYRHEGFWQCMDTRRDRDLLEDLWQTGRAPWATAT